MTGTSESFADRAKRLASLANISLGWPPDTFWSATPADLATVLEPLLSEADAPLSRAETERLLKESSDG